MQVSYNQKYICILKILWSHLEKDGLFCSHVPNWKIKTYYCSFVFFPSVAQDAHQQKH